MNILYKIENNICEPVSVDNITIIPEITGNYNNTTDLILNELQIIKKFYSYIGINKYHLNGEWIYLYKNRETCNTFIRLLDGKVCDPDNFIKYYYNSLRKIRNISYLSSLISNDMLIPFKQFVLNLDTIIDNINNIYQLNITKNAELMVNIKYIISKSLHIYSNIKKNNDKLNYIIEEGKVIQDKCKINYHTLLIILSSLNNTITDISDDKSLYFSNSQKGFTYLLDFLSKVNDICYDYKVILISIQILFFIFFIHKKDGKPEIYDYKLGTLISQYTKSINFIFYFIYDHCLNTIKLFNEFEKNVKIFQVKKKKLIRELLIENKLFVPTNIFYFTHKSYPDKKFYLKKVINKEIDITCCHCNNYIHYNETYYSDLDQSLLLDLIPVHMCNYCTLLKSYRVMCNKKDRYGKDIFKKDKDELVKTLELLDNMEKKSPEIIKVFNSITIYRLRLIDKKNLIEHKNICYK